MPPLHTSGWRSPFRTPLLPCCGAPSPSSVRLPCRRSSLSTLCHAKTAASCRYAQVGGLATVLGAPTLRRLRLHDQGACVRIYKKRKHSHARTRASTINTLTRSRAHAMPPPVLWRCPRDTTRSPALSASSVSSTVDAALATALSAVDANVATISSAVNASSICRGRGLGHSLVRLGREHGHGLVPLGRLVCRRRGLDHSLLVQRGHECGHGLVLLWTPHPPWTRPRMANILAIPHRSPDGARPHKEPPAARGRQTGQCRVAP